MSEAPRRGRPKLPSAEARQAAATRLKVAADRAPLTDFLSYRDWLQRLYDLVKGATAGYSYAQLAEDLGFSRTNVLWLVVTGRRRLAPKGVTRIAAALDLPPASRRYLEILRQYVHARRTDQRDTLFKELMTLKTRALGSETHQRTLEYFSEWYHPVLREMIGLPEFVADPDWINQRLVVKLLPMQIRRSLELIERLGLVVYDQKRGRLVQTGGQILPDREVERLASVRFHQKMCDFARDAVDRVPARRRELNTLTLTLSDEVAMRIGELFYKACEQAMRLEAECKARSEIYQVNVHLFPFTKQPGDL